MRKTFWLGSILAVSLMSSGVVLADSSLDTYTIHSGDTLWQISQRYAVSLSSLISVNPQLKDANQLQSGDTIYLPAGHKIVTNDTISASGTVTTTNTDLSTSVATTSQNTGTSVGTSIPTTTSANQQYTVVSGDTLKSIAQKLGVTLSSLVSANPQISNFDQLSIGMKINIPSTTATNTSTPVTVTNGTTAVTNGTSSVPATTSPAPVVNGANITSNSSTYTIASGDTLLAIAKKMGISLTSLITANPQISNFDNIMPGMVINIPTSGQVIPTTPVSSTTTSSPSTNVNSTTAGTTTVGTTSVGTTFDNLSSSSVKPTWEVKADAIIATGMSQLGVPYIFGGDQPGIGLDCSGFTQYAFNQNGYNLPHNSAMQSALGTNVDKNNLRKGDLIFLQGTYTTGVSHVGIYLGNNQMLHAGTIGTREVKISPLFGVSYYDEHYWGAKRIINDN